MSVPIAASGPAVEKSAGPKATADPSPGTEGGSPFGAMLGVALATPAATPGSTTAVEPKLLELLLDGDWMVDQPAEGADSGASASTVAPGSMAGPAAALIPRGVIGGPATPKPSGSTNEPKGEERSAKAALPLEKDLVDWIGLVTGRERKPVSSDVKRPAHPSVINGEAPAGDDAPAEPAAVPLGQSLCPVGVGSVAAGSVWGPPVADRPVPQPETPVVADATAKSTDGTQSGPAEPKPILLPDIPAAMDRLESDAEELIRRLAPFHRAIEIGGFTFPLATEHDGPTTPPPIGAHPTIQPPAAEPQSQPSPPIRIQSLPGSGPGSGGLDFGSGKSPTSGGSKNSSGDGQQQRPPVITPPPPQSEGRLSDLLIRARREVIGSSRSGPNDKPQPADKDATPSRADSSEAKPAAPATPAPASVAPNAPRRPEIIAEAPGPKATTLDPPAATPRRIDHVMVDLADDTGDHGRLRLALSGSTVRATILPNDPALADRLTAGIRELRVSLEERGFSEPRITVQIPKTETPVGGHLFGRDVVTEVTGLAARGDSQAPTDEDPRGRWRADHSDRQSRDQRPHNRHQREPQDEGRTE